MNDKNLNLGLPAPPPFAEPVVFDCYGLLDAVQRLVELAWAGEVYLPHEPEALQELCSAWRDSQAAGAATVASRADQLGAKGAVRRLARRQRQPRPGGTMTDDGNEYATILGLEVEFAGKLGQPLAACLVVKSLDADGNVGYSAGATEDLSHVEALGMYRFGQVCIEAEIAGDFE